MKQYLIISAMLVTLTSMAQEKFFASNLLMTDDFFAHHVIVAEKSTHQLHLFENNSTYPKLVKSWQIATGKVSGDKQIEGDYKTPEGIYNFTEFLTNKQLIDQMGNAALIYGVGAFVTDYPNPVDNILKKTGSGIWLHSTNDETRIDKGLDSRGCVVSTNNDLIEVSKYLELNKTPMIVVQELVYLNEKTHQTNRDVIKNSVDKWLEAWREKKIDEYMSFYDREEFKDSKGNWNQYRTYKSAVFSMPGKPKIDLDRMSIFQFKNYAVVTFRQKYQSSTINDTGKKILYLIQDKKYEWKIVSEKWTKAGLEGEDRFAFEPSDRFFKNVQYKKGNN